MKTLCVIINYNRKSYTNQLYRALKPYEDIGNYHLSVLDNGTNEPEEFSEFTEYAVDKNVFFGGAVNLIFDLMLQSPEYDSVFILNNDIIVHPYKFVKTLREVMFEGNYAMVAPCALQPEEIQCNWKQMHNWASPVPRKVKWVDFMCPLLHRKVVEEIKQYSPTLQYGWGQDLYAGIVCEEMGWESAVVDTVPVIHMSSQTYKDAKGGVTFSDYGRLATTGMHQFFTDINKMDKLNEFRYYGEHYTFN